MESELCGIGDVAAASSEQPRGERQACRASKKLSVEEQRHVAGLEKLIAARDAMYGTGTE